jgi:outer membrane biosynthesis protein TonB
MGSVSSEQGAETHASIKSLPMALEVPVVATGARPGDKSAKRELFTEATETVLVFENGAVIPLSAAVAVGQLLFLTNKTSGKEIVTQVLRKRNYRPTACYVELEFTEAAPGFWGVEFPAPSAEAKQELKETGIAAELAEAELTDEEAATHALPPDATEMARLRQEVEALKSQLKSLAPAKEEAKPPEVKPSAVKPELMSRNEPAPEVMKQEAPATVESSPAPAGSGKAEENPSYPIRMQLPKAEGTSNRSGSEFAADDAAAERLLPKPNLDFERYRGPEEPSPKLFSGKARRSLSGPIGVVVVVVLLLVALGIMTYRLGWLSKGSKDDASKAAFPSNAGNANGRTEAEHAEHAEHVSNSVKVDTPPKEQSAASGGETQPAVSTPLEENSLSQHAVESESAARAAEKHSERSTAAHGSSNKRAPVARETIANAAVNPADDVVVPPKLVKSIKSLSPPEALRRYVSGKVKLDALVDETGHVKSATAISGPHALYDKAIETVKQYEYQPATKNGKPVPVHVQVAIQFWYEP